MSMTDLASKKRPGFPWFTFGAALIWLVFAGMTLAGYSPDPVLAGLAFAVAGLSALRDGIDQIM